MDEALLDLTRQAHSYQQLQILYEAGALNDRVLAAILGCSSGKFLQDQPVVSAPGVKRTKRKRKVVGAETSVLPEEPSEKQTDMAATESETVDVADAQDDDIGTSSPLQKESAVIPAISFVKAGTTEAVASASVHNKVEENSVVKKTAGRKKKAASEDSEDGEKPKKRIDAGKILALHRAGWLVVDIAKDMNIEESDVLGVLNSR